MKKTLRPYQRAAIDSLFDWLFNKEGHPLVVAPVGSGKSLMIAEFMREVHEKFPRTRIVMISHVKELLVQDAEELMSQYQEADFGFYCASLKEKKLYNDITFASIQSVHSKVADFNRCPEIIIVDEAHLISHNDATQYRKFIESVLEINPQAKVVGFTGTPFRADTGRLEEGNGALFDGIAYEIGIKWMIDNNYLCRPITPSIDAEMNIDGVKTRGGDYIIGQLEKAIDIDETTQACVSEMIEKSKDRKKWLIFTAGVQHCEHVRDALRASGVSAELITGETPKDERDRIIRRYKAGEFTALVNVAVLTTGFNCPDIDMLAFMRPTKSPVLYIQCIGRGIRTAEGKENCLILDFGKVVENLGAIDTVDIRKKKGYQEPGEGDGEAITKRCPSCGTVCAAAQRYCYSCSYNFVNEGLVSQAENDKKILSEDLPAEKYKVLGMVLQRHEKKENPEGKPPTMCVTYATMVGSFKEWVCFEHDGYARDKAVHWHKQRLPDMPVPMTVDDAAAIRYPIPYTIGVKKEGKYNRIIEYDFEEDADEMLIQAQDDDWLSDEIPF